MNTIKPIDKIERKEIKEMAKESVSFVRKGGDPRDLPKHLRINEDSSR
jgi:hypothetical protein